MMSAHRIWNDRAVDASIEEFRRDGATVLRGVVGAEWLTMLEDGVEFKPEFTVPGLLGQAGYQTQLIGKLHQYPQRLLRQQIAEQKQYHHQAHQLNHQRRRLQMRFEKHYPLAANACHLLWKIIVVVC